jgi:hypothetical protein
VRAWILVDNMVWIKKEKKKKRSQNFGEVREFIFLRLGSLVIVEEGCLPEGGRMESSGN